ncbi:MAG TPA: hypothetical protein VH538_06350 [Gaiellaceae bacterium]|jgi:hypothetical protein
MRPEEMEAVGGIVFLGNSPTVPEHLQGRGCSYDRTLRPTEAQVLTVAFRTLAIPRNGWVCLQVDRTAKDEGRWTFARLDAGGEACPRFVAFLTCVDAVSGWRYDVRDSGEA